jgi:hypothetical protein
MSALGTKLGAPLSKATPSSAPRVRVTRWHGPGFVDVGWAKYYAIRTRARSLMNIVSTHSARGSSKRGMVTPIVAREKLPSFFSLRSCFGLRLPAGFDRLAADLKKRDRSAGDIVVEDADD